MKFYTHKTTPISAIDAKFHKNPYSVYEIFNSCKLLSQISVTDTTYFNSLLPATRSVSGDFFTLQQDSAPAHRIPTRRLATVSWDTQLHQPTRLATEQSRSNPVDYAIWGILQERLYRWQIRDVDHLKERLIEEWRRFDQNIIDRAVNQWRDRLH